jgi:hypothetical protein
MILTHTGNRHDQVSFSTGTVPKIEFVQMQSQITAVSCGIPLENIGPDGIASQWSTHVSWDLAPPFKDVDIDIDSDELDIFVEGDN